MPTKQSMMEISLEILKAKAANIRWFFCDIDGTLTDGCVYYSPEGELLKKFSLRDGTGFFLLKQCGIKTGFITTECSPIVSQRAKKLNIDKYIYGTHRKLDAMHQFLDEQHLSFDNIAYIGDEINDVKLMKASGLSFAVADATGKAKECSDIVCSHEGGNGAFREAVEKLLELKGIDIEKIISSQL